MVVCKFSVADGIISICAIAEPTDISNHIFVRTRIQVGGLLYE